MLKRILLIVGVFIELSISVLVDDSYSDPMLNSVREVIDVENNNQFQNFVQNMQLKPFAEMEWSGSPTKVSHSRFTLGSRVGGDYLVGRTGNTIAYPGRVNLVLLLSYPYQAWNGNVGSGSVGGAAVAPPVVVTFVDIIINHNSPNVKIYLLNGGPGQRYIEIAVLALYEVKLSYEIYISGKS